jgi:hypothetical protein
MPCRRDAVMVESLQRAATNLIVSSLSRPKSPRRDFSFGAAACCGPAHCVTLPLRCAWSLCRAAPCVMFPSFLSPLLRPTLTARARDRLVRHDSRDDGPLVPLPARGGLVRRLICVEAARSAPPLSSFIIYHAHAAAARACRVVDGACPAPPCRAAVTAFTASRLCDDEVVVSRTTSESRR